MSTHDEHPDDRDLRAAFQSLRREDRGTAPARPTAVATPAPRPRRPAWLAVGASGAAGLLLWAVWPEPPGPVPEPVHLAWTVPTDFLLETPGAWLLEPMTGDPTAGLLGDLSPQGDTR